MLVVIFISVHFAGEVSIRLQRNVDDFCVLPNGGLFKKKKKKPCTDWLCGLARYDGLREAYLG